MMTLPTDEEDGARKGQPGQFTITPFHSCVARRFNDVMVQESQRPCGDTTIVMHNHQTIKRAGYRKNFMVRWSDREVY